MLDKRKFYIDGNWVDPSKNNDFNVINPSNEDTIAVISLGDIEDTNRAVLAANNSFEQWSHTSKNVKISLLENLLKVYKERFDEMANAISLEMGAPIDWSKNSQTSSGEDHIEDFIKTLKNFYFEVPFRDNSNNYIIPLDSLFQYQIVLFAIYNS